MVRSIYFIVMVTFVLLIKGGGLSYAQAPQKPSSAKATSQAQTQQAYTLQPPPFSFPKDRTGGIKRSIAQFEDWFLICDELRVEKKVVCNVTQAVNDPTNTVVFSWTLATTQEGKPFMLLRTLPTADTKFGIQLIDSDNQELVKLAYAGCDAKICMAQMAINMLFSQQIDNGRVVQVVYKLNNGRVISMKLPLKGLKEAVESVQ